MYDFIDEILGEDGAFSKESPHYQPRPQQISMSQAVAYALSSRQHALIEAGTGTGKTFAYLVPAIKFAKESGSKVIISTKTMNLQSQILDKDIPFLNRLLPEPFKSERVVGIGNFICFYRLLKYLKSDSIDDIKTLRRVVSFYCKERSKYQEFYRLAESTKTLLDEAEDKEDSHKKRVDAIVNREEHVWEEIEQEEECREGTKDEIDVEIDRKTWSEVCAESDSCHRKSCKYFNDCYYFKAKERQRCADVLVVNHALFFADLAVRRGAGFTLENAVLPQFETVIFDEAHDIENIAANFMGYRVSNFSLKHYVSTLASNINHNKTLRKIIKGTYLQRLAKVIETLTIEATAFFNDIRYKMGDEKVLRLRKANFIDPKGLIQPLSDVKSSLQDIIVKLGGAVTDDKVDVSNVTANENELRDIRVFHDRTVSLIAHIRDIIAIKEKDWAYWIEANEKRVSLNGSPIDMAKELRVDLFGRVPSCILTSATLAVNGGFDFLCARLGINKEKATQLIVGSPFNYYTQAMICIPDDCMEPTVHNGEEFAANVAEQIKKIVRISEGRAFVLFTSYKLMDDTYNIVSEPLEDWGFPVFKQSMDRSREKLLADFLATENSILFGAESFWQGVDVPGDKLSVVIIPKMPFANPMEPLVAARLEHLKRKGMNAFFSYSLPDSVLRLKQGTGRLIRRESDRGVVALLDRRLLTKAYGGIVIRSLPNYYQTKNIDDIAQVFELNKEESCQTTE